MTQPRTRMVPRGMIDPETDLPYVEPESVPWVDWYKDMENGKHRWNEDEHYTLIGTTGCGKTTLAKELLDLCPYVAAIATKPRDESLSRFINDPSYTVLRKWEDLPVTGKKGAPKRLIWPKLEDLNSDPAWQQYHIENALDKMFTQGGWNIYLDEVRYISDELKLRKKLNLYLLQYRAMGGSLLAGTQRPAWIPREFYSQSTHLCLWHQTDKYDLDRLAGIGAINAAWIRHLVARLGKHEFLYLHVPTGYMCKSQAPNPNGR